jgi:5-methyltetrahydropteroyltriglutamate--homocysteine methyltransferase
MQNVDHIRTTHVGSLPRPNHLRDLLFAREEGKDVDPQEFNSTADAAVDDVVREQVEAGISIVSDGELPKPGFVSYMITRLSGFERHHQLWPIPDLDDVPELFERQYGTDAMAHSDVARCIGPIEYVGEQALAEDLERFRDATDKWNPEDAFIPSVPPAVLLRMWQNEYYDTEDEYLEALTNALKKEYRAIIDAGFLLQLDCTDIPILCSAKGLPWDVAEGLVRRAVEAVNVATADLPPERMRLHLCWGNWEGPHRHDAPLAKILPLIWDARPQAISFEAANAAHAHEWKIFEEMKVPDGKVLMPGVIDTKNNVVEHPELVAERIERFAGLIGKENFVPGTDCGFGTFAGFGAVFPQIAWMKLKSLGEGAQIASKRLWG